MKYQLNNGEMSTLTHCLAIAAERFASHVVYLRGEEAKSSLGSTTANRLAETMECQANDASTLRRRIENAKAMTVETEEFEVQP